MVCHKSAKFGIYGHSGSGYIMVLDCHMISHDYMIKKPCILRVPASQSIVPSCQV